MRVAVRHPLPYSFARSHRLLLEGDDTRLTLWLCEDSDRSALSEVVRKFGAAGLDIQHTTGADLS